MDKDFRKQLITQCSVSMHQAFKKAHTANIKSKAHVNMVYVWYPHSMCVFIELYQCLRPHNEIHWVMLTLASRLTNRQSYIKSIKLSTQALMPSNPVLASVWGVCNGEWVRMDRNVVVYLLYIWVRVNMLRVLLCFKHSSCLSQSNVTILNNENTIIHNQNVNSGQIRQDIEENTTGKRL